MFKQNLNQQKEAAILQEMELSHKRCKLNDKLNKLVYIFYHSLFLQNRLQIIDYIFTEYKL